MQLMAIQAHGQTPSAARAGDTSREPIRLRLSNDLGTAGAPDYGAAKYVQRKQSIRLKLSRRLQANPESIAVTAPVPSSSSSPAAAAAATIPTATEPVPADAAEQIVLGSVRINGIRVSESAILVRDAEGSFLVREEDIKAWGFRLPARSIELKGEPYYSLSDIPAVETRFDEPSQELIVRAGAAAFPENRLGGKAAELVAAGSVAPGGFLNYDLSAYKSPGSETQLDGLTEIGVFNEWGLGVTNFLLRDLTQNSSAIRLDTTLTRDFPDKMASLRLGDSISQPGSTGGGVRFAGVQWATNFATRPGYITFPQPAVRGEATLPSVVDVFVNDSLRFSQELPPGPFEIANVPVVTGDGRIRLVQRDLLGRQQVLIVPYYASSELLHEGLQAYSYEAGMIRENFGLESNDYGRGLIVATHRYGFTDRFTAEYHAEVLKDQQMLGIAGNKLFSSLITGTLGAAGSHSDIGDGGKVLVGLERQANIFSFGGRMERSTEDFTSLGAFGPTRPRALNTLFAGFAIGRGSVSLNYTDQKRSDGRSKISSVNYGIPLSRHASLNLFALHSEDVDEDTMVSATLTWALDPRTTAVLNASHQSGKDDAIVQVQQALPTEGGVAFRALGGTGSTDRVEAGASLLTKTGLYSVDASRINDQESYRAGVSGGIAILDSSGFLTRRIDESFAVVKVPGYKNLGLYRNNLLIGHTDEDGTALITGLLPYEANNLSLEVSDLPIDAQPESLRADAVPRLRSGTIVKFNVAASAGALVTMVQEDGSPVPMGAVATKRGGKEEYPVGQRGEVYVTGITDSIELNVQWDGQTCSISTQRPSDPQPIPKIGPVKCKR